MAVTLAEGWRGDSARALGAPFVPRSPPGAALRNPASPVRVWHGRSMGQGLQLPPPCAQTTVPASSAFSSFPSIVAVPVLPPRGPSSRAGSQRRRAQLSSRGVPALPALRSLSVPPEPVQPGPSGISPRPARVCRLSLGARPARVCCLSLGARPPCHWPFPAVTPGCALLPSRLLSWPVAQDEAPSLAPRIPRSAPHLSEP